MKIILLKSHDNLGNVGEIINVKSGFARNYLIPNKIGSPATEQNIKSLESFLKAQEIKEAKNRTNLEALSKKLNSLTLKFDVQAGEDDKLFGSVTSQMISDSLQEKGFNILKKEIVVVEPIKFLGEHIVMIDLHKDIDAKVKIMVSALPSD